MTTELLPGDIGFAKIGGRVGQLVHLGQTILADGCRFTHAFMVLGGGRIIEAMPAGARIITTGVGLHPARTGPEWAYARLPLTPEQRTVIPDAARLYAGVPYSFADYAALAALHWRIPTPRLRAYITSSRRMICSQLVDQVLSDVGYRMFDDGRLPQDVTPGALFYRSLRHGHLWSIDQAPASGPTTPTADVRKSAIHPTA